MENQLLYELYETYAGELALYLYSICRDRALAQDLLQEVFLKAMLSLPPGHINFRAWLYKVARNLCFNAIRDRKREVVQETLTEETAPSPLDHILESERNRWLYEGILKLSPLAEQVIILQYFGGLSQKEIASILGISPGNVRVIALRARMQLKNEMELYEKGEDSCKEPFEGGKQDELQGNR